MSQPLIAYLFSLRDEDRSVFLAEGRNGLRYTTSQNLSAGAIGPQGDDDEARRVVTALRVKYGDAFVQEDGHVVPIRLDSKDPRAAPS